MYNDTFLKTLLQLETDQRWMAAQNWMTESPYTIQSNQTLLDAARIMHKLKLEYLPVTSPDGRPYSIVTERHIVDAFASGEDGHVELAVLLSPHSAVISTDTLLTALALDPEPVYSVTDSNGSLAGLLTKSRISEGIAALMESYIENDKMSDILQVILEKAYEGVAVVDENGIIIEFNDAYSRFTGIPKEEAVGRHVTDIIENTNLHETVKKGIPERGVLQNIQGQDMVVHRIPIWKNGKVAGAIGMLIFEGVSDIYRIYERLTLKKITDEEDRTEFSSLEQLIGPSESIAELKRKARTAARTRANVWLIGEKGTGKQAFAESIHQLGFAPSKQFQLVSAPDAAEQLRILLGNSEDIGTVYFESIDRFSLLDQRNIIELLKKDTASMQFILSSAKDLRELTELGGFSLELYALLNPLQLEIPPLRERKEDIPFLLSHYMQEICFSHAIPVKSFSPDAVACLMDYRWNGNTEELIDIMESLVKEIPGDLIQQEDLPAHLLEQTESTSLEQLRKQQDSEEKRVILELLQQTDGNKSKTADLLGIHRTTLYKKMRKYDILT